MKFATVKDMEGTVRVGLVRDGGSGRELVDLDVAAQAAGIGSAHDLIAFIEQTSKEDLAKLGSLDLTGLPGLSLEEVEWLPPVRRPSKVLGVAINNRNTADASYFISDHPALFTSPPSAMIGHGQPIIIRGEYGLTHPEAELGVIIGREAKNLSEDEALEAIFGFTVVNDVTSVDLKSEDTVVFEIEAVALAGGERQGRPPAGFEHSPDNSMQLTYHARSKGTDTFTPIGPWVITPDEVATPDALFVNLSMNGKLLTEDNTASLRNSVADVVSFASRYFTLFPGDVIHLGTAVAGAVRLRDLDFQVFDGPCEIEIQGIGVLSNPIVRI